MNKLRRGFAALVAGMVMIILILTFFSHFTLASENIYGLRMENISRSGADFYWSTSIETKGSVEYAYTKLPELYNPQLPGSRQDILVSIIPLQIRSEAHYRKAHHVKVDNLDLDYDPFVQYTIKSEAFNGEVYTISGEFVLVDTGKIHWWQTWWFPLIMFILGQIAWPTITIKIWKYLRSIRIAKRR
jgi:hypothetical protein